MNKTIRRSLNIILSVIFAAAAAVSAFAAEPVQAGSMEELKAAIALQAESIQLTADIDADELLRFDHSVAIDGNGHNINRAEGYEDVLLLFTGEKALVENLTVDGKNLPAIDQRHNNDGTYDYNGQTVTDGIPYFYWFSAVVACKDTSLTMNDCSIVNNSAEGIYSTHILEMNRCTVSGNTYGVDVYVEEDSDQGCRLIMTDCTVTGNSADGIFYDSYDPERSLGVFSISGSNITDNGSTGLDLWDARECVIKDCIISGNQYSGIYADTIDLLTISDCIVNGNTASNESGGGLYLCNVNAQLLGKTVVKNNSVTHSNGSGLSWGSGGGIYIESGKLSIGDDCAIEGNYAQYYGGGICIGENAELKMNSICCWNNASSGGNDIYFGEDHHGYCLAYDPNNGTARTLYCADTQASSSDVEAAECMFNRPCNLFSLWNTAPDGSGQSVEPGQSVDTGRIPVLYAVWRKAFILESLPGGEGVTNMPAPAEVDGTYRIYTVSSEKPLRAGYEFICWLLDYDVFDSADYKVNYFIYGTNTSIMSSVSGNAGIGETVNLSAPTIAHYSFRGSTVSRQAYEEGKSLIDLTISEDSLENEVTFWYEPVYHSLNYVVYGTSPEGPMTPEPVTDIPDGGSATLAELPSYSAPDPIYDSYIVRYLEVGTDQEIAPTRHVSGVTIGGTATDQAIDIDGYELVGDPEQKTTIKQQFKDIYSFRGWYADLYDRYSQYGSSISNITEDITVYGQWDCETIELARNEIIFYYQQKPAVQNGSYTVIYIDWETNNKIAPDKTVYDAVIGEVITEDAEDLTRFNYYPFYNSYTWAVNDGDVIVFPYYYRDPHDYDN